MASHAGFHDPISLRTDTFFSFLLHFTGKWPCRYPKTPAASLFSASNLQEKASKWCNQSPPAQKLDPNYVKNSVKSPCFPSPFRQTFRCLTHTHTHHLLRSLYGVLRTPTFTGCRLMWGVIWVPKSSIKHHQAAHAWAPGSGGLGTHTTVPLGALLKYHARLNAFYIPYHPSDWNIYISVDFYGK